MRRDPRGSAAVTSTEAPWARVVENALWNEERAYWYRLGRPYTRSLALFWALGAAVHLAFPSTGLLTTGLLPFAAWLGFGTWRVHAPKRPLLWQDDGLVLDGRSIPWSDLQSVRLDWMIDGGRPRPLVHLSIASSPPLLLDLERPGAWVRRLEQRAGLERERSPQPDPFATILCPLVRKDHAGMQYTRVVVVLALMLVLTFGMALGVAASSASALLAGAWVLLTVAGVVEGARWVQDGQALSVRPAGMQLGDDPPFVWDDVQSMSPVEGAAPGLLVDGVNRRQTWIFTDVETRDDVLAQLDAHKAAYAGGREHIPIALETMRE